MSNQPQASQEMFRLRRPRVNGVIAFLIAAVYGAFAALLFAVTAFETGFLVPAITLLLIAIVSVLIGVLAFRVRAVKRGERGLLVPLRILSILGPALAIVGAVIVTVTALQADPDRAALAFSFVGLSGIIFIGSLAVALQGAFVYGAADHAAGAKA